MRTAVGLALALAMARPATAQPGEPLVLGAKDTSGLAESDGDIPAVGDSVDALPGLLRVPTAHPWPLGVHLTVSGGYGFSSGVIDSEDRHHRAQTQLAASYRPRSWLAVAARFSGRYDRHTHTGMFDSGWVGDPALSARATRQLASGLELGGVLGAWFPGSKAPSIEPKAISGQAVGMLSWAGEDLIVSGSAGFRLDRSAHSIDDAAMLSPSDRLSLGVSDSHAVLLGAGVARRLGSGNLFGELSWDLLVGADAPPLEQAPLRAAAGYRQSLGQRLELQLVAELSLAKAVVPDAGTGLYPVDPRVQLLAGLSYRLGGDARAPIAVADDKPDDKLPPPPATGSVVIAVTGTDGATVVGARVELTTGELRRSGTVGDDGRVTFDDLPEGPVTIAVHADHYEDAERTVAVRPGQVISEDVGMVGRLPAGQLRGTVRSYRGRPLDATLTVDPGATSARTDSEGDFEVDLPPGLYTVKIESRGFKAQIREVAIEQNGVTILNVDMRR